MKWLFTFLVVFLMVGCASKRPDPHAIDWNARIGNYTVDQAIAEFGKPDITGESSEGRQLEWVLHRSPQMSFGFGVGSGGYSGVGVGAGSTVYPAAHGEYLRLIFDQKNLLKDWVILKH